MSDELEATVEWWRDRVREADRVIREQQACIEKERDTLRSALQASNGAIVADRKKAKAFLQVKTWGKNLTVTALDLYAWADAIERGEHAAALGDAGFDGYEIAKANLGTLIEQVTVAEKERDTAKAELASAVMRREEWTRAAMGMWALIQRSVDRRGLKISVPAEHMQHLDAVAEYAMNVMDAQYARMREALLSAKVTAGELARALAKIDEALKRGKT